ncbi:unnamed protein product, partial [Effrenium voratum]
MSSRRALRDVGACPRTRLRAAPSTHCEARRLGVPHLWPSRVKVFFLAILTSVFNFSVFQYLHNANVAYLNLAAPLSEEIVCKLPREECASNPDPASCTVDLEDRRFGKEPENEVPGRTCSGMTAALAELQDEWNGREASDVVGLVQSALALVDLYEGASVAQGASEDADGLKDCRIRALQTALDKAAEQRGELRKRLSSAEVARDQAIAELAAAEQRVEEARKVAQRREEDLQAQLEAREAELEELRNRPVQKDFHQGSQETETHIRGVGTVMATPRQHYAIKEVCGTYAYGSQVARSESDYSVPQASCQTCRRPQLYNFVLPGRRTFLCPERKGRNPRLPLRAISGDLGSLHTVNVGWALCVHPFRLWSILFLILTSLLSLSILIHDLALLEENQRPYILSIPNMKYATPCLWDCLTCVRGRQRTRHIWSQNRCFLAVLVMLWSVFQAGAFMIVMYPFSLLVCIYAPVKMSRIMVFLSSILCALWSVVFILTTSLLDNQPYAVLWGISESSVNCLCLCEFPLSRPVVLRVVVLGTGVCWHAINLTLRALKGLRRAQWANMFSVLYSVPVEAFPVIWERPEEAGAGPIRWRQEGEARTRLT